MIWATIVVSIAIPATSDISIDTIATHVLIPWGFFLYFRWLSGGYSRC